MPATTSSPQHTGSAAPDELDRILDYDDAVNDFLQDLPLRETGQNDAPARDQNPPDEDQEVQVKKKRKPVPKLDENLLLSNAGIPKLRKIAKSSLKFRGKGHEFTDITRLLNTYQLWLDDLYPRAKFRDGLAMVEKVGHSKRMQVMRRAWLDNTKPNRRELTPPPDMQMSGAEDMGWDEQARSTREAAVSEGPISGNVRADPGGVQASAGGTPDDDELDALLASHNADAASAPRKSPTKRAGPFEVDEPDDDELDALLAQNDPPMPVQSTSNRAGPFEEDPDDDDLDALMAEQQPQPQQSIQASRPGSSGHVDDFADDEEAMRDMW